MKIARTFRARLCAAVAESAETDRAVTVAAPSYDRAARTLAALGFDFHHYADDTELHRIAGATFEGDPFRIILTLP